MRSKSSKAGTNAVLLVALAALTVLASSVLAQVVEGKERPGEPATAPSPMPSPLLASAGQPMLSLANPVGVTSSVMQAQALPPAQPGAPASQPTPPWQGAQVNRLSRRAEMYYEGVWGVGELRVKTAESGEIIRFNYRVLDPEKAAALNDKKTEPELIDSQAGVKLVVPQMEKIGKLRQSSTPKAGMTYWMAFSNPTRVVRRGHRVDVVIGQFRANGLVVE